MDFVNDGIRKLWDHVRRIQVYVSFYNLQGSSGTIKWSIYLIIIDNYLSKTKEVYCLLGTLREGLFFKFLEWKSWKWGQVRGFCGQAARDENLIG